MKIGESIKKFGLFSLPTISEQPISGILNISESGETRLEIMGIYGGDSHLLNCQNKIKRINGILEDGEMVTLDNCFWGKTVHKFHGLSKGEIIVNTALIGHHYEDNDAVEFYEVAFHIEGLFDWLSASGIKIESNWKDRSDNIQFTPLDNIEHSLGNGIKLRFAFGWNKSNSWKEIHITQTAYIFIISDVPMPLNHFVDIIFKLNNFFCLILDDTINIQKVTGYSKEITEDIGNGQIVETAINIYYPTINYSDNITRSSMGNFLLRYSDVESRIGDILKLWLENYSISEPAFNLYFSAKSGGSKYLDGQFLLLAQGLETLHRRNSQETLFPKVEFKTLLNDIIKHCPDNRREWLRGRISFGNELPLRKRIEKMIEPFKELYGSELERDGLIKKIVATRNYFTHYDPKAEQKSAKGKELWDLCMKLESIFQLNFLKIVGIDSAQIMMVAENHYNLRKKLTLPGGKLMDLIEPQQQSPEDAIFMEIQSALSHLLVQFQQKDKLSQQGTAENIALSQPLIDEIESMDTSVSIDLLIKSLLSLGATREEIAAAVAGK